MKKEQLPNQIPLGRAKNLIGQKFGQLTVLYRVPNKGNKTRFACKCDCGEYTVVRADHLQDPKHTNSCGCLDHPNLVGRKFGKLTVIQRCNEKGNGAKWLCQCQCGNFSKVITRDLLSGHSASCGCIKSKGEYTITKILIDNCVNYEFQKQFDSAKFDNGLPMYFDFYINNSFILQYDGQQHFPVKKDHGWITSQMYEKTHQRDLAKNQWCKQHNIPLKRIPYWDLGKFTLEDILSDKYLVN